MRLNQVTVGATDFGASVAFYMALGFRLIVSAREEYARFEAPEGDATFSIHLQDVAPSGGPVIYFEVDDLLEAVSRLKSVGINFISEPRHEPWLWQEARLIDPAGNELCIFTAETNRRHPPWRIPSA